MAKRGILLFIALISISIATAAEYYVDCSKSSNGDGSYENPWNTIKSVNDKSMSTGDDVYFKVGTTCKGSKLDNHLKVDWNGNSNNWVIIGAYFGKHQFGLNGNDRPVLDGEMQYPTGEYEGMVDFQKGNSPQTDAYIIIQDLHILQSARYGIASKYRMHVKVDNCHVEKTHSQCILIVRTAYADITNNFCEFNSWGNSNNHASLVISGNDNLETAHDVLVSGNIVTGGREGIGLYKGVSNVVVEKNVVYDQYKGSTANVPGTNGYYIYMDAARDITVRYNLLYLSEDSLVGPGPGIQASIEASRCNQYLDRYSNYHISNIKIHNNLIANLGGGINFEIQDGCSATNDVVDSHVYANTIVNCDTGIKFGKNTGGRGNTVQNNLIWAAEKGSMISGAPSGWTYSNNMWSSDPGSPANRNAVIGAPNLQKTTGWSSVGRGEMTGQEFGLKSPSPAINAGLSGDNSRITSAYYLPYSVSVQYSSDNSPDIGAYQYGGASLQTCETEGHNCCAECLGPEYDLTCAAGKCCTACQTTQPVARARANRVYSPVVIDGDISEFTISEPIVLSANPRNNQAEYRLLWDQNYLYIAADIRDTQLTFDPARNEDGSMWYDDAIEILFGDTNNDRGGQPGDYKFFVNVYNMHADALVPAVNFDQSLSTPFDSAVQLKGSSTINNPVDTDSGYYVEARIPISRAPVFFEEWGFEAAYNDRDASQERIQTVWANTDGTLDPNSPKGWGDLVFTHRADTGDQSVDIMELSQFMTQWRTDNTIQLNEVLDAISLWIG